MKGSFGELRGLVFGADIVAFGEHPQGILHFMAISLASLSVAGFASQVAPDQADQVLAVQTGGQLHLVQELAAAFAINLQIR